MNFKKVILYYVFTPIADPEAIRLWQKTLCESLNIKGRILISPQGINGTLGGEMDDVKKYIKNTRQYPGFKKIDFKWSEGTGIDFPKLKIKVKSELVAFGNPGEIQVGVNGVIGGGIHLRPEEVNKLVEERGSDVSFFDARNSFEAKVGKFKNAVVPDVTTSHGFVKEIESGKYDHLKGKPLVMYCTGGIRCEILSVVMKNRGFKEVYQIQGGIVRYGNAFGDDGLWEGSLYTFDDRLTIDFSDHTKLIGQCAHCNGATKKFRNCQRAECHQLVLLCDTCYETHLDRPCKHDREIKRNPTGATLKNNLSEISKTTYGKAFLMSQAKKLIAFSQGSVIDKGGFGYLDSFGKVDTTKARELYIQCRMIQVFGLGEILGLSDSRKFIDHGIDAIMDLFQDKVHGGFFNAISDTAQPVTPNKLAYDHMFVLLAACTAKTAGSPRAGELLEDIDKIIDKYFWDDEFQMMNNSWDNNFEILDSYRGINANMHAVEALCAAYDVTSKRKYLDRAYAISKRAINEFARANNWMLPEHFSSQWVVDKDFNINNPADPFCPYGVTIGHLFEWSRLLMQLKLQIADTELDDSWIQSHAVQLYEKARHWGWCVDGTDGFVYTVDWDGRPVVRSRMFWVAAEAVMTAYTLWYFSGKENYLDDYEKWWQYIDRYVLDKINGSWFHELAPDQTVIANTWPGKPDTYHAFNAAVLPMYPIGTSFIGTAMQFSATANSLAKQIF